MDSTPPASTRSISPARMARKAVPTASMPEPHRRFMVVPGTLVGRPASSADMRATLRLSSPAWLAQPMITSSMASGLSSGDWASTASNTRAARSSGRTLASVPPKRPMAVRLGLQMNTSVMSVSSVAGVVGGGAGLELTQHGQLLVGRLGCGFQLLGEADFPAGGLDDLFAGHAQLFGFRVRLEDAQVGDDHGRATTDVRHIVPGLAVATEADGGDEVHVLHEGALGVLDGNEHFFGVGGDLRCAATTGQTDLG